MVRLKGLGVQGVRVQASLRFALHAPFPLPENQTL